MIAFLLSCVLIFSTSWLISSCLSKNNTIKAFVYLFLTAFAQIVFISEILSLFNKIEVLPFLFLNILFFAAAFCIWFKNGRPNIQLRADEFFNKFKNSLKLDKSLMILFIGWSFFIISSLILIILLPSTSADAFCYHVSRSIDWVINRSLNHFETADIRNLTFPINSEILYMWVILFTKKQLFLGAFSFVGYILSLIGGFQIFKFIGLSFRKTLWSFFILSSFASVIVIVSGTETDLIVAGLVISSIYLFIEGLKYKSDSSIFMSALAYSLAIGVKTPAILCVPAIGIFYILLSKKFKDYKPILKFMSFGVINFLLFSSYNYILNFIDYGNCMGAPGVIIAHKNIWGVKGFIASFIKHLFLFIDFTGIKIPTFIGNGLMDFEVKFLYLFHLDVIPNGVYGGNFFFNYSLLEPGMGCGILSMLILLPCWLRAMITPLFKRRRISDYQAIFGYILLINIMVLSALIAFMTFNTRFLTSFVVISAPVLAYSYIKSNKNALKWFYIFIALVYFLIISTHLWGRPLFRILDSISKIGIRQLRSEITCGKYDKRDRNMDEWCNINGLIESKFSAKDYKVLYMPNNAEEIIFTKIKKMQGYNYDFINLEHLGMINPDEYDIIVYPVIGQWVTSFDKYTPEKIDYYFKLDNDSGEVDYHPINYETEIMCYYNGLKSTISKEMGNENEIPFKKICQLTTNFFNNHPFEIVYKTRKYYIIVNKKYLGGKI